MMPKLEWGQEPAHAARRSMTPARNRDGQGANGASSIEAAYKRSPNCTCYKQLSLMEIFHVTSQRLVL